MIVPDLWHDLLEKFRKFPKGAAILLLGGPDRGKTTFATFVAQTLAEEEYRIAVVDGDIGQSEIGPPGTVGLAWATEEFDRLSDLRTAAQFFVGAFSASALPLEHAVAVASAVRHAREREADLILVDTTGYIIGPMARRLKVAKANLIRPAYLLAFGAEKEGDVISLAHAMAVTCAAEVISLFPADGVQRKPPAMRATRRQTRLAAYFGDKPETILLPLDRIQILGATLGTGTPIAAHLAQWTSETLRAPIAYGEIAGDVLTLFADGPMPTGWETISVPVAEYFNVKTVRLLSLPAYRGVLLGLHDSEGRLLTLARYTGFDRTQSGILAEVPGNAAKAASERIRLVAFGRIRTDERGATLSELKPNEL